MSLATGWDTYDDQIGSGLGGGLEHVRYSDRRHRDSGDAFHGARVVPERDCPRGSTSNIAVWRPAPSLVTAKPVTSVVFPTPPFWETITRIFRLEFIIVVRSMCMHSYQQTLK